MSGLEKIIGTITGEADIRADVLQLNAEKEAAQIRADADARTLEETDRIRKKSQEDVSNIESRAQASAELRKKQILLEARQDLINSCIAKAKAYPDSLDDTAYIALLTDIFRKHVPEKDAVLQLNAKDMKRIPEKVRKSFVALAEERGSVLRFADQPCNIKNGFILDFGGIEENCSIEALIDQNLEEIQDRVYQTLFV